MSDWGICDEENNDIYKKKFVLFLKELGVDHIDEFIEREPCCIALVAGEIRKAAKF